VTTVVDDLVRVRVRLVEECNQRGGRMLTLVDLVEAGTVNLDLAAYLAAVVRRGHSLLVGANPGGAGKTTVMAALLSFLPEETAIKPVVTTSVLQQATGDTAYGATCYLAHEIGAGPYYAYVWGAAARAFFALAGRGHIVASNLHADTLAQTEVQLCDENGVDPADLLAVTLKLYLRLDRGTGWRPDRRVSHVYESDGERDTLMWTHTAERDRSGADGFRREVASAVVSPEDERICRDFLASLLEAGIREMAPVQAEICGRLRLP